MLSSAFAVHCLRVAFQSLALVKQIYNNYATIVNTSLVYFNHDP